MGVTGLWTLLNAYGHKVDYSTLRGKTLAVDASIWLTQFVKAMRNADGTVVRNAHLIGTFKRVIKLLFHHIRPIFVFDGGAPMLKKRTVLLRSQRRGLKENEHATAARKIILKQLQQRVVQSELAARTGVDADAPFSSSSHPLSSSTSARGSASGSGSLPSTDAIAALAAAVKRKSSVQTTLHQYDRGKEEEEESVGPATKRARRRAAAAVICIDDDDDEEAVASSGTDRSAAAAAAAAAAPSDGSDVIEIDDSDDDEGDDDPELNHALQMSMEQEQQQLGRSSRRVKFAAEAEVSVPSSESDAADSSTNAAKAYAKTGGAPPSSSGVTYEQQLDAVIDDSEDADALERALHLSMGGILDAAAPAVLSSEGPDDSAAAVADEDAPSSRHRLKRGKSSGAPTSIPSISKSSAAPSSPSTALLPTAAPRVSSSPATSSAAAPPSSSSSSRFAASTDEDYDEDDEEVAGRIYSEVFLPVVPENAQDVDLSVVASLPPRMQRDYVEALKRKQQNENRKSLVHHANDAAAFSQVQLMSFLSSAKFNFDVSKLNAEQALLSTLGRKIASEAGREYVLINDGDGVSGSGASGAAAAAARSAAALHHSRSSGSSSVAATSSSEAVSRAFDDVDADGAFEGRSAAASTSEYGEAEGAGWLTSSAAGDSAPSSQAVGGTSAGDGDRHTAASAAATGGGAEYDGAAESSLSDRDKVALYINLHKQNTRGGRGGGANFNFRGGARGRGRGGGRSKLLKRVQEGDRKMMATLDYITGKSATLGAGALRNSFDARMKTEATEGVQGLSTLLGGASSVSSSSSSGSSVATAISSAAGTTAAAAVSPPSTSTSSVRLSGGVPLSLGGSDDEHDDHDSANAPSSTSSAVSQRPMQPQQWQQLDTDASAAVAFGGGEVDVADAYDGSYDALRIAFGDDDDDVAFGGTPVDSSLIEDDDAAFPSSAGVTTFPFSAGDGDDTEDACVETSSSAAAAAATYRMNGASDAAATATAALATPDHCSSSARASERAVSRTVSPVPTTAASGGDKCDSAAATAASAPDDDYATGEREGGAHALHHFDVEPAAALSGEDLDAVEPLPPDAPSDEEGGGSGFFTGDQEDGALPVVSSATQSSSAVVAGTSSSKAHRVDPELQAARDAAPNAWDVYRLPRVVLLANAATLPTSTSVAPGASATAAAVASDEPDLRNEADVSLIETDGGETAIAPSSSLDNVDAVTRDVDDDDVSVAISVDFEFEDGFDAEDVADMVAIARAEEHAALSLAQLPATDGSTSSSSIMCDEAVSTTAVRTSSLTTGSAADAGPNGSSSSSSASSSAASASRPAVPDYASQQLQQRHSHGSAQSSPPPQQQWQQPSESAQSAVIEAYKLAGQMRGWAQHAFARELRKIGLEVPSTSTPSAAPDNNTAALSSTSAHDDYDGRPTTAAAATLSAGGISLQSSSSSASAEMLPSIQPHRSSSHDDEEVELAADDDDTVTSEVMLVDDNDGDDIVIADDCVEYAAEYAIGSSSASSSSSSSSLSLTSSAAAASSSAHAPSSVSSSRTQVEGGHAAPTSLSWSSSLPAPRAYVSTASLTSSLVELQDEETALRGSAARASRDADHITDSQQREVIALLQLFGLPYIIAPMEAEAQCAALEMAGLVDGVVTDDSDALLFGAQVVYRSMFGDNKKDVEEYRMADMTRKWGVTRDDLIRSALLLGSDYTEGIAGVGPVNAAEILAAFPGDNGLVQFREWVRGLSPDPKLTKAQLAKAGRAVQFKHRHRNARRKWTVPETFPSKQVLSAYRAPQVDAVSAPFKFNDVDADGLYAMCIATLGWTSEKAKNEIMPLMVELASGAVQSTLDSYLVPKLTYEKADPAARIRSTRLQAAVQGLVANRDAEGDAGALALPGSGAAATVVIDDDDDEYGDYGGRGGDEEAAVVIDDDDDDVYAGASGSSSASATASAAASKKGIRRGASQQSAAGKKKKAGKTAATAASAAANTSAPADDADGEGGSGSGESSSDDGFRRRRKRGSKGAGAGKRGAKNPSAGKAPSGGKKRKAATSTSAVADSAVLPRSSSSSSNSKKSRSSSSSSSSSSAPATGNEVDDIDFDGLDDW